MCVSVCVSLVCLYVCLFCAYPLDIFENMHLSKPIGKLLPTRKGDSKIFQIELVDLAFHLLVDDIYKFAKLLGYGDHHLTKFKADFHPENLEKGSFGITLSLCNRVSPVAGKSPRSELVKMLTRAGYPCEAQLLEYGKFISFNK